MRNVLYKLNSIAFRRHANEGHKVRLGECNLLSMKGHNISERDQTHSDFVVSVQAGFKLLYIFSD